MKPSTHMPPRTLVATLTTAAFFSITSLNLSALAVQATLGTVSGPLPAALIFAGTFAGSAAGGWYSQPLVTRLTAAVHTREERRQG